MRAQFRTRIRFVLTGIVLIALLILLRLYYIQILNGSLYAEKADRQFASGGSGLFDRGSIYFTRVDGKLFSAATLVTGFLVAINPNTGRFFDDYKPRRISFGYYEEVACICRNCASLERRKWPGTRHSEVARCTSTKRTLA
jgi:hypothetical protein